MREPCSISSNKTNASQFLQKLSCQKPYQDQARLSSLVNKQVGRRGAGRHGAGTCSYGASRRGAGQSGAGRQHCTYWSVTNGHRSTFCFTGLDSHCNSQTFRRTDTYLLMANGEK